MQKPVKVIRGAMSQKEAIKKARRKVGTPYKSYHNWVMYVPWKCSDPDGPTTEVRRTTKSDIYQIRANYLASTALFLMDFNSEQMTEGYYRIDNLCDKARYCGFIPAEELLKEAIWVISNMKELDDE